MAEEKPKSTPEQNKAAIDAILAEMASAPAEGLTSTQIQSRLTALQNLHGAIYNEVIGRKNITGPAGTNLDQGTDITRPVSQDFSKQIKELTGFLGPAQAREGNQAAQANQAAIAESNRQKSDALFQQALQALMNPAPPTQSPELDQMALAQLQKQILSQGETALSNVEAGAQRRGITGSSIEAFQTAQTEGNIADTLANTTLQYLLNAGEKGQQLRQNIANQLFQSAQAYLGQGSGYEQLATNTGFQSQGLDLQRQQMAQQIQQFNQSLQESQRQFNQSALQQSVQAQENMNLLLRSMQQGKKQDFLGAGLGGAMSGAATGTMISPGWGTLIGAIGGAGVGLASQT